MSVAPVVIRSAMIRPTMAPSSKPCAEDHFGDLITEVNQEFSATPIGAAIARQLQVETGTPGFVITRRYYGDGGVLLLATITTFPHDKMKYSMTLNVS